MYKKPSYFYDNLEEKSDREIFWFHGIIPPSDSYLYNIDDPYCFSDQDIESDEGYDLFIDEMFHAITPKEGVEEEIFNDKKRKLKKKYKKISRWDRIELTKLRDYCREYALINHSIALAKLNKITLLRKKGEPQKDANNGRGQQHWIPKCYMKSFSSDNNLKRVSKFSVFNDVWNFDSIGSIPKERLVNLESQDFKESKKMRGKFYTPTTEILFSLVENDYAELKNPEEPENFWDYIVNAYFFLILGYRTKHIRDKNPYLFNLDLFSLFDSIPYIIANSEIEYVCVNSLNPQKSDLYLPFTEHPVTIEYNDKDELLLFAIYSRKKFIIIKNRNMEIDLNTYSYNDMIYYEFYLRKIIRMLLLNGDFIYFNPDDPPWKFSQNEIGAVMKYGDNIQECFPNIYFLDPDTYKNNV